MGGEQCSSWLSYPQNPVFSFQRPSKSPAPKHTQGYTQLSLDKNHETLALIFFDNAHEVMIVQKIERLSPIQQRS